MSRGDAAMLLVALVPYLALVAWHWHLPPIAWQGEYAQYLLSAQSVLRGEGLTPSEYIFSPYSSLATPSRPPGLTLLILPIVALFGVHSVVLKLLAVAMGATFLLLAGYYVARHEGPWLGAAVTLMTGVALESAYATNVILPDLGFCALLWGVIVLADEPGDPGWRRVLAITFLGFAAMAFRLPGIAILPAMLLFAVLETRPARLWFLVPVVAWLTALLIAAPVLGRTIRVPPQSSGSIHWLLSLFAENALSYPWIVLDSHLYPFPWDAPNDVYHVVSGILAAIGLWVWIRDARRAFLGSFAIIFALLLLIAPVRDARYVWPLFPLLVLGFARGLAIVLEPFVRRARAAGSQRLAFGGVALLCLVATVTAARRADPPTLLDRPDARRLVAIIRSMSARDSMRLMVPQPRVFVVETGVPAMGTLVVRQSTILAELRRARITHVVVGDLGAPRGTLDSVRATIAENPSLFELQVRDSSFAIWRFRDTGALDGR